MPPRHAAGPRPAINCITFDGFGAATAATALVTTKALRDVLEIARSNRPDLYNLRFRKPEPLVPQRYRFEVCKRVDAHGRVIAPEIPTSSHRSGTSIQSTELWLATYLSPAERWARLAGLPGIDRTPDLARDCGPAHLPLPAQLSAAVTAVVLVRRPSTYWRTCCPSQTRTSVCHPAVMVGPLPEAGLSTLACRPQSLLEETIHSQFAVAGLELQRVGTERAKVVRLSPLNAMNRSPETASIV